MANLNARYNNSSAYQTAAATFAQNYAAEAGATFTRALAECSNQQPTQRPAPSPETTPPGGS